MRESLRAPPRMHGDGGQLPGLLVLLGVVLDLVHARDHVHLGAELLGPQSLNGKLYLIEAAVNEAPSIYRATMGGGQDVLRGDDDAAAEVVVVSPQLERHLERDRVRGDGVAAHDLLVAAVGAADRRHGGGGKWRRLATKRPVRTKFVSSSFS